MTSRTQVLWCLASAALLASCATAPPSPRPGEAAEASPKAPCCERLDDFRWVAMQAGRPLKLRFDTTSDTYVFDGESRRTHALDLGPRPSSLRVVSHVTLGYEKPPYAVYPEFVFLDVDRRLVAHASALPMKRVEDGWWGVALEGRIVVPPKARYVLVRGSAMPGSRNAPPVWILRDITRHADGMVTLRLFQQD